VSLDLERAGPTGPATATEGCAITQVLAAHVRRAPDKVAFEFVSNLAEERDTITFAELEKEADIIAAALRQVPASAGAPALLLYQAGLEFVAAFLGCLMAGVVPIPAPLSPTPQGKAKLEACLRGSQARLVLANSRHAGRFSRLLADVPQVLEWVVTDELSALPTRTGAILAPQPGDLAYLQYSSGSTGAPKGVMVTHGALMANLEVMRGAFRPGPDEVIVSWLPHYHDMGLVSGILYGLFEGLTTRLIAPSAFLRQPELWLQTIAEASATMSGGPNFGFDHCVRSLAGIDRSKLDLSNWRVAMTGAEPVRAETLARFSEAFGSCGFDPRAFYPCYGLAEATLMVSGPVRGAGPQVLQLAADDLARGQVSATRAGAATREVVGCGAPRIALAIRDPVDQSPCPADRVGEIYVQGDNVAAGYYRDPETTAAAFDIRLEGQTGRWLRTGDLGFVQGGELYVVGRATDVIIVRGRNIHPADVEATVQRVDPRLRANAGAVVSIELAGEERLVIAQELDPDAASDANTLSEAIRNAVWLSHGVAPYRVLLLAPGTIPKTSSGKIQRRAFRATLTSGLTLPMFNLGEAAHA
jgi:acyl-CoA synthetase (AMP-forming)/AMP-acid ligase II